MLVQRPAHLCAQVERKNRSLNLIHVYQPLYMHEANALIPNTKAMMQNATARHSITNTSLKTEQRPDPDNA
jgi:hypothetical protein